MQWLTKHTLNKLSLIAVMLWSGTLFAQGGLTVPETRQFYLQNCAVCHGENLEGSPQGTALLGDLRHGESTADIMASITNGYVDAGMPAWGDTLSTAEIRTMTLFVMERRENFSYQTFNHQEPLALPADVIESDYHDFRLGVVAEGLDALPFSIAPLPDGRLLVTEKKFGVRIINVDGSKSDYLSGTPQAYADTSEPTLGGLGNERGWGWLFDIAIHPDYENNGWVYLYYGDRCSDCNDMARTSGMPVSMNKLVRGRIEGNAWVDEEVLWEADQEHYGNVVDVAAGGRIDFDDSGHVFFSVGMKGPDNHHGIQDLSTPWGKIHRINDDGSIPADNPFADRNDVYRSIYTYGHRSPQGLVYDHGSGELFGTEHGPRGGDEVNHLQPGRNYGWPLYSLGMNYDGTPVDYGQNLGIAYELADIEQPIVDLTPSPAVSSFIISGSEQFPEWQGDFLVGSLKARSLYRFRIENDRLVERETLLDTVARIRDVEEGFNGEIYLLLEHATGARIVQLVPAD